MKKIKLTVFASVFLLVGCSNTVMKDQSGSKIVDLLHAHYAEEVLQAMNRLADSQDLNKVNVLTPYNQNNTPINQSYNGTVTAQRKIVMPDTYPQKEWRDNTKVTTTYVKAGVNDANLTPTAKEQVVAQGNQLTTQNGKLITENKVLRDDMKTTQNTAQIAKTQAQKDIEAARVAALKEKQRIETSLANDVKQAETSAAAQIKAVESKTKAVESKARNAVVIE